jgi:hypothetical protein
VCIKLLCEEKINFNELERNLQNEQKDTTANEDTEEPPKNKKSTKIWKRNYNEIFKSAKKLKDFGNFVVFAMGIGRKALKKEAIGINNGVDILIATPDRFLVHHNAGILRVMIITFIHQFKSLRHFKNKHSHSTTKFTFLDISKVFSNFCNLSENQTNSRRLSKFTN